MNTILPKLIPLIADAAAGAPFFLGVILQGHAPEEVKMHRFEVMNQDSEVARGLSRCPGVINTPLQEQVGPSLAEHRNGKRRSGRVAPCLWSFWPRRAWWIPSTQWEAPALELWRERAGARLSRRSYFAEDGVHFNERGTKLLALVLFSELRSKALAKIDCRYCSFSRRFRCLRGHRAVTQCNRLRATCARGPMRRRKRCRTTP